MATNLDIELNAGVLPDLDSAKKAGAALKAEMAKALASLPGEIRDATKVYLSALGTAKSGQSVYNAVSNIRTGIKRGIAVRTALDGFTPEQEDAIRQVDEFVKQRANVLRRLYITAYKVFINVFLIEIK